MQPTIRSFDLAHLAHVELLTPKPEASLRFFVDVLGTTESGRRGDSVYLRGWDDYEHHTLKLTASTVAGMGQPIVWTEAERTKGQAWGLKTIETFHTHGTPPIELYSGPRER
jgi:catechol 2,3-dioxygenase-like lactoylglutathione lyase family enzyme